MSKQKLKGLWIPAEILLNNELSYKEKIVSSLKEKGYVDVKLKYKIDTKKIEERQIIPITESINRYSEEYLFR